MSAFVFLLIQIFMHNVRTIQALRIRDPLTEVASFEKVGQDVPFTTDNLSKYLSDLLKFDDDIHRQFMKIPVELNARLGEHAMSPWKFPTKKIQQCAVVGNGRNVLLHHSGATIDNSGFVMRLNDAPTGKYSPFVGSKTDIMLINHEVPCKWKAHKRGPPAGTQYIILNDFGTGHIAPNPCKNWLLAQSRLRNISVINIKFHDMNSAFLTILEPLAKQLNYTLATELHGGRWATSGLIALMFLKNMCKDIQHFGFYDAVEMGSSEARSEGDEVSENMDCIEHYWDSTASCETSRRQNSRHSMSLEHVLLAKISTAGICRTCGIIHTE